MAALFAHQPPTLSQKIDPREGFVLMQKKVSSRIWKNEYLLRQTVNCTRFRAFISEMWCNMLLNAVHFGAKCKVFWC